MIEVMYGNGVGEGKNDGDLQKVARGGCFKPLRSFRYDGILHFSHRRARLGVCAVTCQVTVWSNEAGESPNCFRTTQRGRHLTAGIESMASTLRGWVGPSRQVEWGTVGIPIR